MNKLIKFVCLNALLIGSASLAMDVDQNGQHPRAVELCNAALNGNKKLVQELLDAGVPVDATNNEGDTALMYAARRGHKEISLFLIDANAQIDAKNNDGRTALMWAARWGRKKICQLLVDAMLKPIKQKRAAAIALLGMKKYNRATCMRSNNKDEIQIIAHLIFDPREIKDLFAQINSISNATLQDEMRAYIHQQMNPERNSYCTIL